MMLIFRKIYQKKLIRFFLVSGINTIFGYGLFVLLIYAGLQNKIAVFISTITGILFNFKTTGLLVFKNKNNLLVFRYFLVYFIVYISNLVGLEFVIWMGINVYLGGAMLIVPIGLMAFFLNKRFVFVNNQNYKKDINRKCKEVQSAG